MQYAQCSEIIYSRAFLFSGTFLLKDYYKTFHNCTKIETYLVKAQPCKDYNCFFKNEFNPLLFFKRPFALSHVMHNEEKVSMNSFQVLKNYYRMRAIISRGLYMFYLIFHCSLYCRAVSITQAIYVLNKEIEGVAQNLLLS